MDQKLHHNNHSSVALSPHHRQVRRKMEDENRKARRVARREYNDALRDLTAFVKKRDKRVAKVRVLCVACWLHVMRAKREA